MTDMKKVITDYQNAVQAKQAEQEALPLAKQGRKLMFMEICSHLFNAMLLMFLVALIGHPLGYLVCLLAVFTISKIIGATTSGETLILYNIYKQLGGK